MIYILNLLKYILLIVLTYLIFQFIQYNFITIHNLNLVQYYLFKQFKFNIVISKFLILLFR